jgi:hypothetical protein
LLLFTKTFQHNHHANIVTSALYTTTRARNCRISKNLEDSNEDDDSLTYSLPLRAQTGARSQLPSAKPCYNQNQNQNQEHLTNFNQLKRISAIPQRTSYQAGAKLTTQTQNMALQGAPQSLFIVESA